MKISIILFIAFFSVFSFSFDDDQDKEIEKTKVVEDGPPEVSSSTPNSNTEIAPPTEVSRPTPRVNTEAAPPTEVSRPAPAASTSIDVNCDLNYQRLGLRNSVRLSTDPTAVELRAETGIAILELTREFSYSGTGFSYTVSPPVNQVEVRSFTRRLANLMKTYPKSFLRANERVCFLLSNNFNNAQAMVLDTIIVTPTRVSNSSIHHELMHAIDQIHSNDTVYNAWRALNPPGFAYNYGPASTITAQFSTMDSNFISLYAKSTYLEDRAEVFAGMSIHYPRLLQRVGSNSTLLRKINSLKAYLQNISPSMNESYWTSRPRDERNGFYENCMHSTNNDAATCADNLVFLPSHSDWNN
jgi:hypothetical protein